MSALKIRRLGYALGAEVTGVDFRGPVDDETIAAIRKAWLEHNVLCFPCQDLDPQGMTAVCGRFGTLDDHRSAPENRIDEVPTVKMVSSKPLNLDRKAYGGERSGHMWHSDLSFTNHPSTATFLHAKELPDVGGDTMFANMYLAYDALSPTLRKILDGLWVVHDQSLSATFKMKSPQEQAASRSKNPPVAHPAIRVHPETGRRSLFVDPRVRNFVGMTEEESKPLVDFLQQQSVRYEFVYRHRWIVGDLVMWDNRCTEHYAVPDYDRSQLRRMLRCTMFGEKSGYVYDASKVVPTLVGAGA